MFSLFLWGVLPTTILPGGGSHRGKQEGLLLQYDTPAPMKKKLFFFSFASVLLCGHRSEHDPSYDETTSHDWDLRKVAFWALRNS